MKNFNRLVMVVLCCATLFFFVTANTDMDLAFGLCMLEGAVIFMCFSIIEEQKEEISRLRKGIHSYQKSMNHSKK
jgi:hypothetical protein